MTDEVKDWRKPENHRIWWRITVGGWGEFAFYGNQFEAEEHRAANARRVSAPVFKEPIPRTHRLVAFRVGVSRYKSVAWFEKARARKNEKGGGRG